MESGRISKGRLREEFSLAGRVKTRHSERAYGKIARRRVIQERRNPEDCERKKLGE